MDVELSCFTGLGLMLMSMDWKDFLCRGLKLKLDGKYCSYFGSDLRVFLVVLKDFLGYCWVSGLNLYSSD